MDKQMTMQFVTAITDCFKDEDNRELYNFPQIESEDGNEIVLSMLYAFQLVVNQRFAFLFRLFLFGGADDENS